MLALAYWLLDPLLFILLLSSYHKRTNPHKGYCLGFQLGHPGEDTSEGWRAGGGEKPWAISPAAASYPLGLEIPPDSLPIADSYLQVTLVLKLSNTTSPLYLREVACFCYY